MTVLNMVAQISSAATPVAQVQASPGSLDSAATRFSDLLSAGATNLDRSVTPVQGTSGALPIEKPTLGDSILHRLGVVGDNYRSSVAEAVQAFSLPAEKLGLSGLLRIQMSMAQVSLNIELISKGIAKAAQHVDSLTKLQ
jgi:type III secretion system YscI/HrpB-like protein